MTSGPVVVQVLEGESAVAKNREVMGATNPKDAAPGTIRADFAESIEANSVHGSDAPDTAAQEIKFFLTDGEIVGCSGRQPAAGSARRRRGRAGTVGPRLLLWFCPGSRQRAVTK